MMRELEREQNYRKRERERGVSGEKERWIVRRIKETCDVQLSITLKFGIE